MQRPRSINQNIGADRLPDFRRLGTVMRIVLLVNAAALLVIVAQASSWQSILPRVLHLSAFLQPVLLCLLLALYAANTVLSGWSYGRGATVIVAVSGVITLAIEQLGGEFYLPATVDAWFVTGRDLTVAMLAAALMLGYFRMRAKFLSPALQDARLQALQARIRPHFLFNSINAVLSIVRSQPKQAETALEDMADLFRMAMADSSELVPLHQEIVLAKQYLALETLRLGERLKVVWQIQEVTNHALIPPLILQPLLENAVYHGIENLAEGGTIEVGIQRLGKTLALDVSNPVPAHSGESAGNRMALRNIRERLALQFDVEASYTVEKTDERYCVRLQLPFLNEDEHE